MVVRDVLVFHLVGLTSGDAVRTNVSNFCIRLLGDESNVQLAVAVVIYESNNVGSQSIGVSLKEGRRYGFGLNSAVYVQSLNFQLAVIEGVGLAVELNLLVVLVDILQVYGVRSIIRNRITPITSLALPSRNRTFTLLPSREE